MCARAPGGGRLGRARSGPGSSPGFAGRRRRRRRGGEAALSLPASGSQACGSVGPAAGAEGVRAAAAASPSRGRGPARPRPPAASEPPGPAPAPCCPAAAGASFCLASAFHAPSSRPSRRCRGPEFAGGPCAGGGGEGGGGGGGGRRAQLLLRPTGRRQVAGPSCCEVDAVSGQEVGQVWAQGLSEVGVRSAVADPREMSN